ncbi:(d)CMP kinase [Thiomicrospira microaerophila]|uniref:(d)CMP kinase n=1 Tax=Thiomicrospira microaerophila TaxID=406020 RepID=UPI00200F9506|nr:(d)CMP kinase [Thiomicrospira microaerophila]UQB43105.1 (d)CMP kinase [Thiomicrospira microaerophila]
MVNIITIDGPSGVGKGTLCQLLCEYTGYHFLDSGAIYRTLAYGALAQNLQPDDQAGLVALAEMLPVEFIDGKVLYKKEDISLSIRNEQVAGMASKIAALPEVRTALLQRQKDFAQSPGLVADGRDMGTVVFPQAKIKLFLTASAQVRAERRVNQLKNQGVTANIVQIIQDIVERDQRDASRSVAPLVPASDAIVIDTSELDIAQVFDNAKQILQKCGI